MLHKKYLFASCIFKKKFYAILFLFPSFLLPLIRVCVCVQIIIILRASFSQIKLYEFSPHFQDLELAVYISKENQTWRVQFDNDVILSHEFYLFTKPQSVLILRLKNIFFFERLLFFSDYYTLLFFRCLLIFCMLSVFFSFVFFLLFFVLFFYFSYFLFLYFGIVYFCTLLYFSYFPFFVFVICYILYFCNLLHFSHFLLLYFFYSLCIFFLLFLYFSNFFEVPEISVDIKYQKELFLQNRECFISKNQK